MRTCAPISPRLRGLGLFCFVALFALAACGKKPGAAGQVSKSSNPHFVTITWAPSKSPVAGYFVYRVSPDGRIARLTGSKVSETQYTDLTVEAGQTYSYYVTSIDPRGVESKPSEKITATVPKTVAPPATP